MQSKMNVQLRKLRGVLSIALIWGALWAAIFAALAIVIGIVSPHVIDEGEGPVRVGTILGGVGIVAGIAFGILLSIAESERPIRDIGLGRAAMWGVLASAVFPLLTGREDQVFILCPVGAILAMTGVAIARKAERSDSTNRLRDVPFAFVLASVRDTVNPPTESPS